MLIKFIWIEIELRQRQRQRERETHTHTHIRHQLVAQSEDLVAMCQWFLACALTPHTPPPVRAQTSAWTSSWAGRCWTALPSPAPPPRPPASHEHPRADLSVAFMNCSDITFLWISCTHTKTEDTHRERQRQHTHTHRRHTHRDKHTRVFSVQTVQTWSQL